jgi:hypothetical protein
MQFLWLLKTLVFLLEVKVRTLPNCSTFRTGNPIAQRSIDAERPAQTDYGI